LAETPIFVWLKYVVFVWVEIRIRSWGVGPSTMPLGRVFDPEAQTRRELRAERLGAGEKATGTKA
jgi:hypothetical protein